MDSGTSFSLVPQETAGLNPSTASVFCVSYGHHFHRMVRDRLELLSSSGNVLKTRVMNFCISVADTHTTDPLTAMESVDPGGICRVFLRLTHPDRRRVVTIEPHRSLSLDTSNPPATHTT